MDKSNYETYEFLPVNTADTESDQFFVVNDDGTVSSVNRPVQYVSQFRDHKEDESQSAVYDVPYQQFYVDVDNSAELISVYNHFILPEGDSNMYANSYLLQVDNEKQEQMEQDNVDQYEETTEVTNVLPVDDVNIENAENKSEDCTEITLSDEQYQLLEKNGWILLEINEKIYLLDNLGLHDITDDEKLIDKLKNEIQGNIGSTDEELLSTIKEEILESNYDELQNEQSPEEIINVIVAEDDTANQNSKETSKLYKIEPGSSKSETVHEGIQNENLTFNQTGHDYVILNSVKESSYKREKDALRIKTNFSFRDIPPQIVLGKSANGKKLVASVRTEKSYCRNGKALKTAAEQESCNVGLDEAMFDNLIQEVLWGTAEKCSEKDVTAAQIVVDQLLRVPAFRPTVLEKRLIITKVITREFDEPHYAYTETIPTLVTGKVTKNDGKMSFMYLPEMLQMAVEEDDEDDINQRKDAVEGDNYLHIHIKEMKGSDGITRISITLNKRHISLKDANKMKNGQNMVYACSACAAVYKTEEGLRLHQETECMEMDNNLTIEEENTNTFTVINTDKGKQFMCNQCHVVFPKLANCQQHIKIHSKQDLENNKETPSHSKRDEVKRSRGVFKCKMCPSSYFHASTLSKHIVSKHIKLRTF